MLCEMNGLGAGAGKATGATGASVVRLGEWQPEATRATARLVEMLMNVRVSASGRKLNRCRTATAELETPSRVGGKACSASFILNLLSCLNNRAFGVTNK